MNPASPGRPGASRDLDFLQMRGGRLSNRSRDRISAIRATDLSSRKEPMIRDRAERLNGHAGFHLFSGFLSTRKC